MREHDQRQALRRDALGHGDVRRNLEAVARLVGDPLHRRQRLARHLVEDRVLPRQRLRLAVEEVRRSRLDVAPRADDVLLLVAGRRPERDVGVRQLALEPLVVGLVGLVPPVVALPFVDVVRADQFVGDVREQRAPEIHPALRVGLDELLLAAGDVQQRQARQVGVTLAGFEVDALAVLVEPHGPARLEDAAFVDLGEPAFVDAQDLGVALVRRADGEAQLVLQVEFPAGDTIGVLSNQRPLAGRDLQSIDVVPRGIAVVDANEHHVGIHLRHLVDEGPDALGLGEVARQRHLGPCRRRGGGIDRVHVEVLVAALILDVQDELPVATPEELADGPLRVGRDRFGLVEGLGRGLDPDVAGALERPDEGDVLAVRRDLRARDLGVAEEQLAVEQRRDTCGIRRRRSALDGHSRGQRHREHEPGQPRGARPQGATNDDRIGHGLSPW